MKEYWKKIYKTRYFWSHLAKNDLKARFRRSKLGLLWTILQPLCLTLILTFVYGTVFQEKMGDYSMYVLSGIIVWNLMLANIVGAGSCLFASEQYIRQFNHPISIYSLRSTILNLMTFLLELIALAIWVLFMKPENLLLALPTLPLTVAAIFPLSWGFTTIAGYSGAKYRDYSQVMSLVMQMLYFVSPVFLKQELFANNEVLELIGKFNPITHILNLVRMPFVYMKMPGWEDYLFVLGVDMVVVLWAVWVDRSNRKKVVFYL